jgi:hypothetical protein
VPARATRACRPDPFEAVGHAVRAHRPRQ